MKLINHHFKNFYFREFQNQLDDLIRLINDAYDHFRTQDIDIKWTAYKDYEEYGFYLKKSDGAKSVFLECGLIYEKPLASHYAFALISLAA